MPVFPKRRFQHGAIDADALRARGPRPRSGVSAAASSALYERDAALTPIPARAGGARSVRARAPRPAAAHDPWRPRGSIVEDERRPTAGVATRTVFLTGRECPWRCVMCDLWRTRRSDTPRGAIRADRRRWPSARWRRAGSPPDDQALQRRQLLRSARVPDDDYDDRARARRPSARDRRIASRAGRRSRGRFRALARVDELRSKSRWGSRRRIPRRSSALNKRMTLDDFAAAAALEAPASRCACSCSCHRRSCRRTSRTPWLLRSIDAAFACRRVGVSLIPTRPGNGAIEALAERRLFAPPSLRRPRAQPRRWRWRARRDGRAVRRSLGSRAIRRPAGSAWTRGARLRAMNLAAARRASPCHRSLCRLTARPARPDDRASTSTSRSSAPDSPGALTALALRRRAARRADRARPASALRDRRVDDAARQPPARGAGRSLRPAADPRVLEVGHVAARRIPTSRAASSAGSRSSSIDSESVRRRRPRTRGSCSSRRARTTRSPTRTGIARTSISAGRRGRARGRDLPRRDALDRIRDRAWESDLSKARATGRRSTSSRVRHRRQRPARISDNALGTGDAPCSGCRRRRASTRTSRASSAGIGMPPHGRLRRHTRRTRPRCTTCFRAAGSGCCASTTASRAPAPR